MSTTYSHIFKSPKHDFVCSNRYVGFGLMINAVRLKTEVRKRIQTMVIPEQPEPQCFRYREFPMKKMSLWEYDRNLAYLTTAKELEIISGETFERIARFEKFSRLFLLGSLATKKLITEFENGKEVQRETKTDKELRNVWFYIVNSFNERMEEIFANNPGVMFYWFDQIYSVQPLDLPGGDFKCRQVTTELSDKIITFEDGRIFPVIHRTGTEG